MSSTTEQPRNRRHIYITNKDESCAGEKTENRAKTRISSRHSHHHPPHDSEQYNYGVELVRVCRLAVVAAAAACSSYFDNENHPPSNEARAVRMERRRAFSAQLAGRVVRM